MVVSPELWDVRGQGMERDCGKGRIIGRWWGCTGERLFYTYRSLLSESKPKIRRCAQRDKSREADKTQRLMAEKLGGIWEIESTLAIRVDRRDFLGIWIDQTACTSEANDRRPTVVKFRLLPCLLQPPAPHALSLPTTKFDDGFNIPAAGRARSRSSNARCVYPGFKHRERHLRYPTSANRLWFRWCPLECDPGTVPTLRRRTADSRLSRTRWPTTRTMSSLGGIVGMYVEYSTGG
jgi:hypothetical protein